MKRALIAVGVFLWILSICDAQLLWKIEINGCNSYVFGTHHFAPIDMIDSIPGLDRCMNEVDVMYGELDMAKMLDMESMMAIQQGMMAPSDSTLSVVLSKENYAKLDSVWQIYTGGQMPLLMIDMLKPMAVMSQLEGMIVTNDLGQNMQNIDIEMQQRAKKLGKRVVGLETLAQQMRMLMGAPIIEQAVELTSFIDEIENNKNKILQLTDAYKIGDFHKLASLVSEANIEDPKTTEKMIYRRNEQWVSTLVPLLGKERVLIVVGAGHLPGERGLLNLLQNKGYNVTPVRR